jgi:hypothetical protein
MENGQSHREDWPYLFMEGERERSANAQGFYWKSNSAGGPFIVLRREGKERGKSP